MATPKKPYPRAIRQTIIGVRKKGLLCMCCEDIAMRRVVVANNEDEIGNEILFACNRHSSMAFDNLQGFYKHFHGRQENLKYERELDEQSASTNQST